MLNQVAIWRRSGSVTPEMGPNKSKKLMCLIAPGSGVTEYFSDGAKSKFPNFSWCEICFFLVKFSILADSKQISVVSKSEKQNESKIKKKKRPLIIFKLFSLPFQIFHLPCYKFPSFLVHFPFFLASCISVRLENFPVTNVRGALCPPAPAIKPLAPAHNIRGTVWMKNNINGFTDSNLFVKPCILFFIQTLPRILCAGVITRVSFLDLKGRLIPSFNSFDHHMINDQTNDLRWNSFIAKKIYCFMHLIHILDMVLFSTNIWTLLKVEIALSSKYQRSIITIG